MRHAEEDGNLALEQYGSRKNLLAAKHALNKRLVLDILRVKKRPAVICANNAKASQECQTTDTRRDETTGELTD